MNYRDWSLTYILGYGKTDKAFVEYISFNV